MARIIVDTEELQSIATTVEMYADILEYVDESDVDDLPGYAEQLKQAASALSDLALFAEPVKGE